MSDYEVLREMLTRAGIDFEVLYPDGIASTVTTSKVTCKTIVVERGYVGFVTLFSFGEGDRLTNVEAYE